jgi:DNA adenine methylase
MLSYSPLRYPGGKARVANYIRLMFRLNNLIDGEYVEPYAGGASVALALLFGGYARCVHINDADPAIHAFWAAVLSSSDVLCRRVSDATLDVDEWRRQRAIYRDPDADRMDLAFATFYLNRTNRSGVITQGGVIGGLGQDGAWKIDARFTKPELVRRIERVAEYRAAIRLTNLDASDLLQTLADRIPGRKVLVYLDPPYYKKGGSLYRNYYSTHQDHVDVASLVQGLSVPWVVSYDNVEEVCGLYSARRRIEYGLRYTARERYDGREVMFFSDGLVIPGISDPTSVTDRMVTASQLSA